MARGNSGRIVLEVDPDFKRELYDALDKDGLTLREWFLTEVNRYLKERFQLRLFETVGRTTSSEERK
jgi:hypothetical protein